MTCLLKKIICSLEDGLNTNSDMAYSLKHKTMIFETQTRDVHIPPKKPLCQSRTYLMPNMTVQEY